MGVMFTNLAIPNWGPILQEFHPGFPRLHLSRLTLLRQARRSIGGRQVARGTVGRTAVARMQIDHLGERQSANIWKMVV